MATLQSRTRPPDRAPWVLLLGCFLLATSCSDDPVSRPTRYRLTVDTLGQGGVAADPAPGVHSDGTQVTLTATADSGYLFSGWSGDVRSAANPLRFTLRANTAVTANFTPVPSGMVLLRSAGASFTMGSASAMAAPEERPPHAVRFNYDFSIDRCEVTQAQYAAAMGMAAYLRTVASNSAGTGDSLPVYNVNWYEAALYCNAVSKAAGLDTVYAYTAVCADNASCPYVLEGLTIHYERFGYRLPTEAEWEFAARGGSTSDYSWGSSADSAGAYAWYSANAGSASAAVGRKAANGFGLYDMAGNVAEWVDDWLAPYPDSLTLDPVGPRHLPLEVFEASWERPVRGGCWELGTSFLRPSCRRGPYAAPARMVSRTIGLRTVLGAFAADTSGVWRPPAVDTALGLRVVCRKSDLVALLGTSEAKLVFTQSSGGSSRLCFVDFTQPQPAALWLPDTLPAVCPAISPDGRLAACGSRREGFSSLSTVTVRPLDTAAPVLARTAATESAYLPRWWVDPQTADTFLIAPDGAALSGTAQWQQQRTWRRRLSGGALDPPQLVCSGSYHGGLSADGRFIATGYPQAWVQDLLLGDLMQYFVPPANGLSEAVQVCNVSASPGLDSTDQVLLLDFGTAGRSSSLVGRAYDLHEYIFRVGAGAASASPVKRWYAKPAGFQSWSSVTWSNHARYAAAVAWSADTQSIFLIDLDNSAYLEVLRGPGIDDPFWWTDPALLPQRADPYRQFGRYDLPIKAYGQLTLSAKLKLLWSTRSRVRCGLLGSSVVHFGLDPAAFSRSAINLGTCESDQLTAIVVAREYVLRHCAGLAAVVMSLDPGYLQLDPHPAGPFLTGFADSQGHLFDLQHGYWADSLPAAVADKIAAFNSADWPGLDSLGYPSPYPAAGGGWGLAQVEWGDYSFSDSLVQMNLGFIADLADSVRSHGVHLVVVQFPENPAYASTGMVGRYGPSRATFDQVVAWLRNLEAANSYFHFYDANNYGSHDYTDAEASDMNHLNALGGRKLGGRVDSLLTLYGVP